VTGLVPVDLVSDELSPPDGRPYWTSEEMYDPSLGEPSYVAHEVARIFFARSVHWLRKHVWEKHLILDGEPMIIPRDEHSGYLRWRLYDVERTAYALMQNGYLKVEQLQLAIGIVKLVAQNYKYLLPSGLETRIYPGQQVGKEVRRERPPMAVKTIHEVEDDLDGSPDATTHRFAIEDVHYRIDLTDENWKKFLEALQPYVLAAQPDKRRRAATPEEVAERADIRAWAKKKGLQVGERGRIPNAILEQYHHTQKGKKS
jgi:hypothetical protein